MPGDFIINTDHGVVFSYGWHTLTYADVMDHRRRLTKDPRFRLDYRQVVDLRDVTEARLSSDEIQTLAIEPVFAPDSRRALVTNPGLHFGLGRMFHGYSATQNTCIFQELSEATEWVGVPMEVAGQAFCVLREAKGVAK